MEALNLKRLSLTLHPNQTTTPDPWFYCIIKSGTTYCTKCALMLPNLPAQFISYSEPCELLPTKAHALLKVQVWDYDKIEKVTEVFFTKEDLTASRSNVELCIADGYQRNLKICIEYQKRLFENESKARNGSFFQLNTNSPKQTVESIHKATKSFRTNTFQDSSMTSTPTFETSYSGKGKLDPNYFGDFRKTLPNIQSPKRRIFF